MLANFLPNVSSWTFLGAAIVFEVLGTTSMKLSGGFKNVLPSVMIFVFYGFAFVCNTLALRKLDISVSYAIWAGIGTALTAIIGIGYFKEPVSVQKVISLSLIVIGVIGLRLTEVEN
jgi:small multidrug resistance pump